ncbi:MAG: hypothetical protein LRZ85_00160 [Alphaproteobacteria bacterium]|nr:hypothetical protein [Alphaproteobacteria bacterium]MCD8525607.1 hypothetical protein [Alphaproteobacteria bacterium]MCD8571610.1 hypothetical protein [Alphaproteobacteria bacterium]
MKTKRERNHESGNVLVYVLIAIVLFAALSFTLSRQTDTSETGGLDDQRVQIVATELITYAANAKAALDKMEFSNIYIEEVDFTLPSDSTFNDAPTIKKIYHPDGGGLNLGTLPEKVAANGVTDPAPGWYMGRFNNVEWTPLGPGNTAGAGGTEAPYTDIVLTAYGITQPVCAAINEKITGSTTIPSMTDSVKETLVPKTIGATTIFVAGTNTDFTTDPANTSPPPVCAACHNVASLCVEEGGVYGFYNVLATR